MITKLNTKIKKVKPWIRIVVLILAALFLTNQVAWAGSGSHRRDNALLASAFMFSGLANSALNSTTLRQGLQNYAITYGINKAFKYTGINSNSLRNILTSFTAGSYFGSGNSFNFNKAGLQLGLSMATSSAIYSLGKNWDPALSNLAAQSIGQGVYNSLNNKITFGNFARGISSGIAVPFKSPDLFRTLGAVALESKFRDEYTGAHSNLLKGVIINAAMGNAFSWLGSKVSRKYSYTGNVFSNIVGDIKETFDFANEDFITQGRGYLRNSQGRKVGINPVDADFGSRMVRYAHAAEKQSFFNSLATEYAYSLTKSSMNTFDVRVASLYTPRQISSMVRTTDRGKIFRNQLMGLGLMYAGGRLATESKFSGGGFLGKVVYSIGTSGFVNPGNKNWYKQFSFDFGPIILRVGEGKNVGVEVDRYRLALGAAVVLLNKGKFQLKESLSYGTPIFTTNNSPIKELIRSGNNNGMYFSGMMMMSEDGYNSYNGKKGITDRDLLHHELTHALQRSSNLYLDSTFAETIAVDHTRWNALSSMVTGSKFVLGGGSDQSYHNNIYESMAEWKFGSGRHRPAYARFTPTNAMLYLSYYKINNRER